MREGTKMIVSTGQGTFTAYFVSWKDDNHIIAITRFGGEVVISQHSVLEFFV